jgi:regulatory protein YycI of two-component signal transduction system YycFG
MNQNRIFLVCLLLMGLLLGMFFFQMYVQSKRDHSFSEGMERDIERVQHDAIAAGVPPAQAKAISSAMSAMRYEVALYMMSSVSSLMSFNFTMVMILMMVVSVLGKRPKTTP